MPLRVAFIAAECEPWAKTGGLADVVDGLARALGRTGVGSLVLPIDVFLPRYRGVAVPPDRVRATRSLRVPDPASGPDAMLDVRIVDVAADGYRLRLVDQPGLYDRDGGPYGDAAGDYPDNARRFALLCRAALAALEADGRPVDVLHLHDWHASPAVRYVAPGPGGPATLLTIHNLAYHGRVPADRVGELGPEWSGSGGAGGTGIDPPAGGGAIDLLAAGVALADLVTTVSPGFADEARTPAFGQGLDAALRARGDRFFGILNGLDADAWDPATDEVIAARYDRADRSGKRACRRDLLARVRFDPDDPGTVLGMVGRLDRQKGFDLAAAAAPALVDDGVRLVVEGAGEPSVVDGLRELAAARPDRVALIERFDRDLARRIYAGADGFLMPSRFEPCGLAQMIALRYGTPPIVHAVGGLRDTVVDVRDHPAIGTGLAFADATRDGLLSATRALVALHRSGGPGWADLVSRGMAVDFDWGSGPARRYVAAYRRAVAIRRAGSVAG